MGLSESKPREVTSEFCNITRNDFPDDFVFGTATSAYQVEGAAAKGGRGLSVWDTFALETPGRITDGSNGNVAVDMYTRFKEDIKMMKNMGFEAYRFSISWPRILPGGKLSLGVNQEGVDYYNDVINTLLANGIQPYVTLFHWDLPVTLEQEYGGFLDKQIVTHFVEFAEVCFWEFGDRVKHWITFNESWSYVVWGYVGCVSPPGRMAFEPGHVPDSDSDSDSDLFNKSVTVAKVVEDIWRTLNAETCPKVPGYSFVPYKGYRKVETLYDLVKYGAVDEKTHSKAAEKNSHFASGYITDLAKDAYIAGRNMLLAHAEAVHSYRTKFQERQKGKIGVTLVSHWFEPWTDAKENKAAAERALDFMLGWFLEPMITGNYPENMIRHVPSENLQQFSGQEVEKLKGSMDFLGLNYYTAYYAANQNPGVLKGYNRDQNLRTHKKTIDGERIGEKTGAKWLHFVPWGFYKLLEHIDRKYNKDGKFPDIYITENGYSEKADPTKTAAEACKDQQRIRYYQDHLGHLLKAINSKSIRVNVKGYFAWSWCDNFEWAEGYTSRFGLVYIDFMNNLKRYPKDSAIWFSRFLVKKEKPKLKENPEPSSPSHGDQKKKTRPRRHLEHEKMLSSLEV